MKEDFRDVLRVEGVNAKGFGIIPKLVMQDSRLTIEAKAIYSYFRSFAGAGTTAFPRVDKICRDLDISEERYRKHFNKLKDCGYIKCEQAKDGGRFSHNIYILIERPEEQKTPSPCFAGTENLGAEIPCTEDMGTNNNSGLKNNSINNKQSVNQREEPQNMTDRPTETILEASELKIMNLDPEDQQLIRCAVEDMYYSQEFARKEGFPIEIVRARLNKLNMLAIDKALSNYKRKSADIGSITDPIAFFRKTLWNSIAEAMG